MLVTMQLQRYRRAGAWSGMGFAAFALAVVVAATMWSGSVRGQERQRASSLAEAIAGGEVDLEFRYRFETVDQAGFSANAMASTLKSRIGFRSLELGNAGFFLEFDDVSYLGDDEFNNTRNGKSELPLVADPDGSHVNQAYVDFRNDRGHVRLGRQRINLGEQRFVGGVAWRQNEQTMDALTVVSEAFPGVDLHYSYVLGVSRIFGPENGIPSDYYDSNSHLLHADIDLAIGGTLSLYYHAIDLENAAALSNRTLGARFARILQGERWNFPLHLEYARQHDHGDNPIPYEAGHLLLEAGVDTGEFRLLAGHAAFDGELGKPGMMFRTPLATLHKFQGWTDRFLTIPGPGVEDTYLTLTGRGLTLSWHDFRASAGSARYGREWDVSWRYVINDNYSLLLKYATYDPETHASDVDKAWVQFTASF